MCNGQRPTPFPGLRASSPQFFWPTLLLPTLLSPQTYPPLHESGSELSTACHPPQAPQAVTEQDWLSLL